MTSYSNQKRNIWINLDLPDWRFEITLVISYIKYLFYGTNSFFPSFLGSRCLWRCSNIGGCGMSDIEPVEMFVRDGISGTSGMWRGTLTLAVAMICFNMRFWLQIWTFWWCCCTTREFILLTCSWKYKGVHVKGRKLLEAQE